MECQMRPTRHDITRPLFATTIAALMLLAPQAAKSADAPILSMRTTAPATLATPAGRVVIGRGKDYAPVGAHTDPEVLADQLSKSMKARRDFAWQVVERLLQPIKVRLPDNTEVDVPLWQTW